MKRFEYKAKNIRGETLTGLIESIGRLEAVNILKERGLVVYQINEKKQAGFTVNLGFFSRISSNDITSFTRQLSTMIIAGLTLSEALSILKAQANPKLGIVLEDVVKQIEGGSTFFTALSSHPQIFSKTYLSLIKSGESSGKLDEVLTRLATNLEKQEEFKAKIKGALIYPAIVIVGMVAVAFIMMIFVIPKLTQMYEDFGIDLPATTQILISVSGFVSRFWYLVIAGFIVLVYFFLRWRQTIKGKSIVDKLLLSLPIIGKLNREIILTQITQTLSMLISAGVPIIESLNIVAQTSNNAIFEKSIKTAAANVEKGLPLAASLSQFPDYPPVVIQMVSVGEETGKLGEVLERLSRHFEMETEVAIKGLTSSIEPLMMVILGIGVGFLVISIITPIYKLTSSF